MAKNTAASSKETENLRQLIQEEVQKVVKDLSGSKVGESSSQSNDEQMDITDTDSALGSAPQIQGESEQAIASGVSRELLGDHLPMAIKQKIWELKYVDFYTLLPIEMRKDEGFGDPLADKKYDLVAEKEGTITIKSRIPTTHAINLNQWLTAYEIFSTIVLEKLPQKAPELIKYQSIIRDAAYLYSGFAWRIYDIKFRQKHAADTQRSWAIPDTILWLRSFTGMAKPAPYASQTQQAPRPTGKGICISYNKDGVCKFGARCRYSHKCANSKCGLDHPLCKCPTRKKSPANDSSK
jgi:hypothetical protein